MISLERKLKWNAIGLLKKTEKLLTYLHKEKEITPSSHSSEIRKLNGFIEELAHLLNRMNMIDQTLIPELESKFRIVFPTPEMIYIALSRPSIRTVYENLKAFLCRKSNGILTEDEFVELGASGDAGDVLALVGDAVLDLAIVQILWDSSIATVGKLTEKKTKIVSNEHLAKVSDEWHLFDYQLNRSKEPTKKESKIETIVHEKATLVEAIYGVIYLEFGFEEFVRLVPMIKYPE